MGNKIISLLLVASMLFASLPNYTIFAEDEIQIISTEAVSTEESSQTDIVTEDTPETIVSETPVEEESEVITDEPAIDENNTEIYIEENTTTESESTETIEESTEIIYEEETEETTEIVTCEEIENETEEGTEIVTEEEFEEISEEEIEEIFKDESEKEEIKKKINVIEVSNISEFIQAVSSLSAGEDLTSEYTFTKDSSVAVVEGSSVDMGSNAIKTEDSIVVPSEVFSKDESINQDSLKNSKVDIETVAESSDLDLQENGNTVELIDPYKTKRLIVTSQTGFDPLNADSIIQGFNNMYVISYSTSEDTKAAYEYLKTIPGLTVEKDSIVSVSEVTDQSLLSEDGSGILKNNNLTKYLDENTSSSDVKIGVIDTGINGSLPEFAGRIDDCGYNFASSFDVAGSYDENGHGTEISYLIAVNTGKNVTIVPYKVSGSNGKTTSISIYMAVMSAIENDVDVINISMNSAATESSVIVSNALNDAYNAGIAVIVSAGNAGNDVSYYSPSNVPSAIVVGSVDENYNYTDFSNYGSTLDYVSDGTNIVLKDVNGNEKITQGTSYSSAIIAAAIANIKSIHKEMTVDSMNETLSNLAIDLGTAGWDSHYGNGYLSFKQYSTGSIEVDDTVKYSNQISLLDFAEWESLSDTDLRIAYANSNNIEIAIFLQKNKTDLKIILDRIPALKETMQVVDPNGTLAEPIAYEYFLTIDVSEYETSAGRDLGHLSGYFWFYISCTNYYYDTSKLGKVYSWYKITTSNSSSGESNLYYTLGSQNIDRSGNTSVDLFNMDIGNNNSGTSLNERQPGGTSSETENGVTCYTIFQVKISYDKLQYHKNGFSTDDYYPGRRLNSRSYTIDNAGSNTLDESSYTASGTSRITFIIQINAANTGQASYFDKSTGKWVDDPDSMNAQCHVHQSVYVAPAYCNDYYGSTYLGTYNSTLREYPFTFISGSEFGKNSYTGYHYSSSTTDNYYPNAGRALSVKNMYALNTYTVKYNGNGATSGSVSNSSHTYAPSGNPSSYLNSNNNGFVKKYTATFSGNGGKVNYGSNYAKAAYAAWQGWYKNTAGTSKVNYGSSLDLNENLTSTHNATINVYAKWGTITTTTPEASVMSRTGYDFLGWNTSSGATSASIAAGSTITLTSDKTYYAVWKLKTFPIVYEANGGDGSMSNGIKTWGSSYTMKDNAFIREGYDFVGWSTSAELDPLNADPEYQPGSSYTTEGALTLYAIWTQRVEVAYIGNEQTAGNDFIDAGVNDAGISLSDTYSFSDNTDETGEDIFKKASETSYTDDETGEEVSQEITSTVVGWSFRDNVKPSASQVYNLDSSDEETKDLLKTAIESEAVTYGVPNSDFGTYPILGSGLGNTGVRLCNGIALNLLGSIATELQPYLSGAETTPYINLYGVWDNGPTVKAFDLYYSLAFAQSTTDTQGITIDEILSYVTATDEEDSNIVIVNEIPAESDREEDTTYVSVVDYAYTDFTSFTSDGSVSITYQAIDSAGNKTEKQIMVYIVDSAAKDVPERSYTRFINEIYYSLPHSVGGLEDESIWLTDEEYVQIIQEAFYNRTNKTPEETYEFTSEQIEQIKVFISENGIGNSESDTALTEFANQFMQ